MALACQNRDGKTNLTRNSMKVVILCGGKGTRLREETEFRPKPMVPIGQTTHPVAIMKYYASSGTASSSSASATRGR